MLVPVNAQTEFVRVLRQLDSDRKKLNDMKAAAYGTVAKRTWAGPVQN